MFWCFEETYSLEQHELSYIQTTKAAQKYKMIVFNLFAM